MHHRGLDPYRRELLKGGLAAIAAAPFVSALQACSGRSQVTTTTGPYGYLQPTHDLSTGLPLLQLPPGFSYRTLSWTGDPMQDGNPVPPRHDGMAVLGMQDGPDGPELILVRNHENGIGRLIQAPAQYDSVLVDRRREYGQPGGGTTNLFVPLDPRRPVRTSPSLGGTLINCAGGPTPWGSWLSCEETITDLTPHGGRRHGYVFEVTAEPADTTGAPIIGMGRFKHEAAAVDPQTGIVYLAEDSHNRAGLYRYVPLDASGRQGLLALGGQLQAAKVAGVDKADLLNPALGDEVELEWIDIPDPDADPGSYNDTYVTGTASGPYLQARAAGALRMSRGEGIWYADGRLYIVDTSAGTDRSGRPGHGAGSVWMLDLASMRMQAIFARAAPAQGNHPDNITVSPRGGILLCEDGGGISDQFGPGNRLMGLLPSGESYVFAKNNLLLFDRDLRRAGKRVQAGDYRSREFCGACFDPAGEILFVNIQTPGITFAITGPWERGPL